MRPRPPGRRSRHSPRSGTAPRKSRQNHCGPGRRAPLPCPAAARSSLPPGKSSDLPPRDRAVTVLTQLTLETVRYVVCRPKTGSRSSLGRRRRSHTRTAQKVNGHALTDSHLAQLLHEAAVQGAVREVLPFKENG